MCRRPGEHSGRLLSVRGPAEYSGGLEIGEPTEHLGSLVSIQGASEHLGGAWRAFWGAW